MERGKAEVGEGGRCAVRARPSAWAVVDGRGALLIVAAAAGASGGASWARRKLSAPAATCAGCHALKGPGGQARASGPPWPASG
eukprot:3489980-Prymnesium_polylepis.1